MIKDLKTFYRHPFKRLSIEEGIANETEKACTEVIQCDNTIRDHEFLKHMALAKIRAMNAWIEKGEATK